MAVYTNSQYQRNLIRIFVNEVIDERQRGLNLELSFIEHVIEYAQGSQYAFKGSKNRQRAFLNAMIQEARSRSWK